jgi:hypothetical protein
MTAASPFWWLAGGLGFAFLVTSGRAQALYDVITAPIEGPDLSSPTATQASATGATVSPVGGRCPVGYILDPATRQCIRLETG